VYREIGGTRPWGSAVVGLTVDVTDITQAKGLYNPELTDLLVTWPGAVAVATVPLAERTVTLVSMYGLIDNGYADTAVNRMLSDLVPLIDSPTLGHHLLLGGDLNITTQWTGDRAHYVSWEGATLRRIEAFGLVDCLDAYRPDGPLDGCDCTAGATCRHIRTQYHPRSTYPWQNDYVFATEPLRDAVKSAVVHDEPAVRPMSDHLPLIVDLVG
jgi:hypothetical protein